MSNHWKDSQFWTKVQKSTSDVIRRLKEVGGNEETRYSLARYKEGTACNRFVTISSGKLLKNSCFQCKMVLTEGGYISIIIGLVSFYSKIEMTCIKFTFFAKYV